MILQTERFYHNNFLTEIKIKTTDCKRPSLNCDSNNDVQKFAFKSVCPCNIAWHILVLCRFLALSQT